MKKILFIGIDNFILNRISREIKDLHKEHRPLCANTTEEVLERCAKNPDIELIVFIGCVRDKPYTAGLAKTTDLVEEIREILGKRAEILTASPDGEFNTKLIEAGCDDKVDFNKISKNLSDRL